MKKLAGDPNKADPDASLVAIPNPGHRPTRGRKPSRTMTANSFKKKYAVAVGLLGIAGRPTATSLKTVQGRPISKSVFCPFPPPPPPDPEYEDGSGPREQGPEKQEALSPVKDE